MREKLVHNDRFVCLTQQGGALRYVVNVPLRVQGCVCECVCVCMCVCVCVCVCFSSLLDLYSVRSVGSVIKQLRVSLCSLVIPSIVPSAFLSSISSSFVLSFPLTPSSVCFASLLFLFFFPFTYFSWLLFSLLYLLLRTLCLHPFLLRCVARKQEFVSHFCILVTLIFKDKLDERNKTANIILFKLKLLLGRQGGKTQVLNKCELNLHPYACKVEMYTNTQTQTLITTYTIMYLRIHAQTHVNKH